MISSPQFSAPHPLTHFLVSPYSVHNSTHATMPVYHIGASLPHYRKTHLQSTNQTASPLPPQTRRHRQPARTLVSSGPGNGGPDPRPPILKGKPAAAHLRSSCQRLQYGPRGRVGVAGSCRGVCDASGAFGVSFSRSVLVLGDFKAHDGGRVHRLREELCEDTLAYDLEF